MANARQETMEIHLVSRRPRLHAVQFSALVEHYLKEQRRRVAASTVNGYQYALTFFVKWWTEQGPLRQWSLDEDALLDFMRHLAGIVSARGSPLSYNTRNDISRRLRALFHWAHNRNYIESDFSEYVPGAKGAPTPRVAVSLGTVARLLEVCACTWEPERNRAIVAVLAGTGVRNEECAALRKEAVKLRDDGSGTITVHVAKNNRPRIVAFDSMTGLYLGAWMVMLPYDAGPLFPSRNGRKAAPKSISPWGLYKILDVLIRAADASGEVIGAHDLRRLFATTWHKSAPEQTHLLQKQLGHQQVTTTMGYILRDSSDVADTMRSRTISPMAHVAKKEGL